MPGQKRRAAPKAARATKRRRTYVPKRVPRPMGMNALMVKKTFYYQNWAPNATTTNGFWRYYSFSLGDLPDLASYVATFDTAKINAIRVQFHPRFDNFAGNDVTTPGGTDKAGTRMSIVVDPKSNLVPTGAYSSGTYNGFLEQGRIRTYEGTRPFSVYFKPVVNVQLGSIGGQYRRKAPYLQAADANSQAVSHTGFHAFAWTQNFNQAGSFGNSFDLLVTFYMTFRGQR